MAIFNSYVKLPESNQALIFEDFALQTSLLVDAGRRNFIEPTEGPRTGAVLPAPGSAKSVHLESIFAHSYTMIL